MPGKNRTSLREIQVADKSIEASLQLLVEKAVKSFKEECNKKIEDLKTELLEVKRSQDFISSKYDKLKDEYSKLIEKNKKQDAEIQKLKAESNEMSAQGAKEASKLDALEQYGRRQNLEIVGIPVTSNEDTNAIVQEIAELLQVTITSKDISTSHRLHTKSKSNPTPIIVRFVNRDVRNRIYNNRKNARNADFTKLSIKGVEKIFIYENLTYLKKKLFWKSKQKAKEAGFKFFWTMNGNVYVRKLEDDKPILIKNEQDLDLIK